MEFNANVPRKEQDEAHKAREEAKQIRRREGRERSPSPSGAVQPRQPNVQAGAAQQHRSQRAPPRGYGTQQPRG